MKPAKLVEVREQLLSFTAEMFASLPRSEQRRWGETYLRHGHGGHLAPATSGDAGREGVQRAGSGGGHPGRLDEHVASRRRALLGEPPWWAGPLPDWRTLGCRPR